MNAFKDHVSLMTELIERLEQVERPFYERQAARSYWAWHALSIVAIAISVATAVTAESIDGPEFEHGGKLVLTILPIVATAVTALSNHFRFHEKEALREAGRIEIEDIILNAKSLAADAKDEKELRNAYHAVRQRAYQLEMKQHTVDVALRSRDRGDPRLDDPA